jgi:hypothetical protein
MNKIFSKKKDHWSKHHTESKHSYSMSKKNIPIANISRRRKQWQGTISHPHGSPGWPAPLRRWGEQSTVVVQASSKINGGAEAEAQATERSGPTRQRGAKVGGSDLCRPCALPLVTGGRIPPSPSRERARTRVMPLLPRLPSPFACSVPRGHAPPWAAAAQPDALRRYDDGTSLAFDHPTRRRKLATDPPFNASPGWVHGRTGVRHWSVPAVHARTFRTHHLVCLCAVRFGSGQRQPCRMVPTVEKKRHQPGRGRSLRPGRKIITTGRSNHAVAHPNPGRDTSSLLNRHADYATRPRSLELPQPAGHGHTPRGSDIRAPSNR